MSETGSGEGSQMMVDSLTSGGGTPMEVSGHGEGQGLGQGDVESSGSSTPSPKSPDGPPFPITIKWMGKEFHLEDVSGLKTVRDLKMKVAEKTGVNADRQRLLNLTFKGKPAIDTCPLSHTSLKPNGKIMMMGSLEKDIESVDVPPEERPEINNDLDIPDDDEIEPTESREVHLNKIAKRVKEYNVKILNPCRPNKKLLVLDIDYTLFDHRSSASSGAELMRPGLHEFLTAAYKEYDIVIWSATSMKWIDEKMKLLGVTNHSDYKIAFHLDYMAMITVHTQKYGVVEVKPLGVIWGKFPQYSNKNTIMFDDLRRNFIMNPQSGLRIRPFRQAHLNRTVDRELFRLTTYLETIASLEDFTTLDHQRWESYLRNFMSHRRINRRNLNP